MGTLTGEKLKKKFCSLKLTRPLDEFVIFDTRPQDLIVVLDNLTTASMDPWEIVVNIMLEMQRSTMKSPLVYTSN